MALDDFSLFQETEPHLAHSCSHGLERLSPFPGVIINIFNIGDLQATDINCCSYLLSLECQQRERP